MAKLIPVFDAHCDFLNEWDDLSVLKQRVERESSRGHWDLVRFREGGGVIQIAVIWTPPNLTGKEAFHHAMEQMERVLTWAEKNTDILSIVRRKRDLMLDDSRIKLLISLEGASPLIGSPRNLRLFFQLGVRALTLTWNHRNELADGVSVSADPSGLTDAGRLVVAECERLGVAVDVSHLAERGFWDLCKIAQKPFFASHSNLKGLCNDRRNLSDKQSRALAEKGGIACLTFVPEFTGDGGLVKFVRHYERACNLIGAGAVGLGSDFDGCTNPILPDSSCYPSLADALYEGGFSRADVRKLFGGNLRRYFRATLPS